MSNNQASSSKELHHVVSAHVLAAMDGFIRDVVVPEARRDSSEVAEEWQIFRTEMAAFFAIKNAGGEIPDHFRTPAFVNHLKMLADRIENALFPHGKPLSAAAANTEPISYSHGISAAPNTPHTVAPAVENSGVAFETLDRYIVETILPEVQSSAPEAVMQIEKFRRDLHELNACLEAKTAPPAHCTNPAFKAQLKTLLQRFEREQRNGTA